ncbi:MAG: type II/IV secretion system protein [Deltaproteobacteria bacterium]|nr:type II/IV secretion system protein [Deltaproteobacteria bacterium]
MEQPRSKKLGDRLLDKGLITPEQLKIALEIQKTTSRLLGQVLVDLGFVDENELASLLSQDMDSLHIPSLEGYPIDPEALRLVPKKLAQERKVMPLSFSEEVLTVAVTDPFDIVTVDDLRRRTQKSIKTLVSSENEILKAIDFWYAEKDDVLKDTIANALAAVEMEGGGAAVEEPPLIKLVNYILLMGMKDGATDIHVEPEKNAVIVRYRVDGIMHVWEVLPKRLERSIISRFKIMANLDISESRLPQDGRAEFSFGNRLLDLRVSVFPTSRGENIVVRVLDRTRLATRIDELGFAEDTRSVLRRLIQKHQGIILVTGPTGSGKTTTLYASLLEISSPRINIMTIEDPIEYDLPFIRQSQINPRAGFTFAGGLRSILRQDPDVILVGEIRDTETLEVSMHSALTGHLVLSTIHTNSAVGAIARLAHLGAPSHILGSSLIGIVSQRLIRKVCPECGAPYKPTSEEEEIFRKGLQGVADIPPEIVLRKGKGCDRCKGEGYLGRLSIGEIIDVDHTVYTLILDGASEDAILQHLLSKGYRTIYQDGLIKVLNGTTTLEELSRVV